MNAACVASTSGRQALAGGAASRQAQQRRGSALRVHAEVSLPAAWACTLPAAWRISAAHRLTPTHACLVRWRFRHDSQPVTGGTRPSPSAREATTRPASTAATAASGGCWAAPPLPAVVYAPERRCCFWVVCCIFSRPPLQRITPCWGLPPRLPACWRTQAAPACMLTPLPCPLQRYLLHRACQGSVCIPGRWHEQDSAAGGAGGWVLCGQKEQRSAAECGASA